MKRKLFSGGILACPDSFDGYDYIYRDVNFVGAGKDYLKMLYLVLINQKVIIRSLYTMKYIISVVILIVPLLAIVDMNTAYAAPAAYIDPNTGGMLFQILAVAFTLLSGVIFFFSSRIKMAFARLMRFLREKWGREVVQESDSQPTKTS